MDEIIPPHNNIYTKLRSNGAIQVEDLRNYSKTNKKLANYNNRRIYLLRCKQCDITPKFLMFNDQHITPQDKKLCTKYKNLKSKFLKQQLNILITDTTKMITTYNRQKQALWKKINSKITNEDAFKLQESENKKYEKIFSKTKFRNKKKIENLIATHDNKTRNIPINQKWIENLSRTVIPNEVQDVLALGPNYAPHTNVIPTYDIIASIETGLKGIEKNNADNIRANVSNAIKNIVNKNKNKKPPQHTQDLNKKIKLTREFLKKNEDLIILKADKTNKTVIMNKLEYNTKINQLLNCKKTYTQLKNNPTKNFQDKNNKLVKTWMEKNFICKNTYNNIKINNSHSPKLYGLPKLHKIDIPLRPIVSSYQTPFYNLSKFLTEILSHITNTNPFYIKNSWDLKNKIKNIHVPSNYILVSYDIISLYTNIPITIAIQCIENKWHQLKDYSPLPKKEFLEAIELVLNSSYFEYDKKFYKQTEGVPMGLPISSIIAQIVLECLEETVIPKFKFHIPFYFRYVDDCITAIPREKVNEMQCELNNFHPQIQFTCEVEQNQQLNFLELTLHRIKNCIETSWYTKDTWSGRYLHFESTHNISQKKNIIANLADRAISLTDEKYRSSAISKAKAVLEMNGYPRNLITDIFKKKLYSFNNITTEKKENTKKDLKFISIPITGELHYRIKNILKPFNVEVTSKPFTNLKHLYSKLKTPIEKFKQTHVVYEIPCQDCNKIYIGNSLQYLDARINGHKYSQNSTALKKHTEQFKHTFDFANTSILKIERNNKKREVLESIYIKKKQDRAVNDRTDIGNLNAMYNEII